MAEFTVADAEALLAGSFAPWIKALGIRFDAVADGQAILRITPDAQLHREGGTVCGQAIMALADTAMVFAVCSVSGEFVPMTTVGQNTAFLRPAGDADLIADARIIKRGRAVVYGEVNLHAGNPDKPVAHVTSTYMLL